MYSLTAFTVVAAFILAYVIVSLIKAGRANQARGIQINEKFFKNRDAAIFDIHGYVVKNNLRLVEPYDPVV